MGIAAENFNCGYQRLLCTCGGTEGENYQSPDWKLLPNPKPIEDRTLLDIENPAGCHHLASSLLKFGTSNIAVQLWVSSL